MYALNLGADGRVLSVTPDAYAPADQPRVDALPNGDGSDYRYVNGQYIYDPIPQAEPAPNPMAELEAQNMLLKAQVQALAARGEFLEDCIAEMAVQVYGV